MNMFIAAAFAGRLASDLLRRPPKVHLTTFDFLLRTSSPIHSTTNPLVLMTSFTHFDFATLTCLFVFDDNDDNEQCWMGRDRICPHGREYWCLCHFKPLHRHFNFKLFESEAYRSNGRYRSESALSSSRSYEASWPSGLALSARASGREGARQRVLARARRRGAVDTCCP